MNPSEFCKSEPNNITLYRILQKDVPPESTIILRGGTAQCTSEKRKKSKIPDSLYRIPHSTCPRGKQWVLFTRDY